MNPIVKCQLVFFLQLVFALGWGPAAQAQTLAQMKQAIAQRACPPNPQKKPLAILDDVCPSYKSFGLVKQNHCWQNLTGLNNTISRYNSFIEESCLSRRRSQNRGEGGSKNTPLLPQATPTPAATPSSPNAHCDGILHGGERSKCFDACTGRRPNQEVCDSYRDKAAATPTPKTPPGVVSSGKWFYTEAQIAECRRILEIDEKSCTDGRGSRDNWVQRDCLAYVKKEREVCDAMAVADGDKAGAGLKEMKVLKENYLKRRDAFEGSQSNTTRSVRDDAPPTRTETEPPFSSKAAQDAYCKRRFGPAYRAHRNNMVECWSDTE